MTIIETIGIADVNDVLILLINTSLNVLFRTSLFKLFNLLEKQNNKLKESDETCAAKETIGCFEFTKKTSSILKFELK